MKEIEIAGRRIGPGHPVFIVAEAGVNHNGSLEMAKRLIDEAVKAGVDAIKFQTFKAEKLVSSHAPKAAYQLKTTDPDESQLEMLKRLELSFDAFREVRSYCQKKGILFFSTPFDEESVDFLDELGVPLFKIGSGEITNFPFLEYAARKGKPIILSTGMSHLEEVEQAVRIIRSSGCDQLVLLHCVSNYPADPAEVNLRAIKTMIKSFQLPVGYSDHTAGVNIAIAAIALGACMIEKHITIDRTLPGPDHRASLEPIEFKTMITNIRTVELAMGNGRKAPTASELENRKIISRSVAAAFDIPQGTVLISNMLQALRPATGISPILITTIVGRRVKRSLKSGQLVHWEDLE